MRHDPPALMIFAAGFGTRMRHLTQDRPKPLVRVSGRALIDYALELAHGAGIQKIVANLHYLPHLVQEHLSGTNVQTLIEAPEILETGGGLRNALPLLGQEPVITMNSDAIWVGPNPVSLAMQMWDPAEMDALLVCVSPSRARGYEDQGDFTLEPDGQLRRGPGLVYGGIQMMKTDVLHNIDETSFSLNVAWNKIAKTGRLKGLEYPGHWCDVGHPGGIEIAENMLAQSNV